MGEVAERRGRGRTWAISRADDRYDVYGVITFKDFKCPKTASKSSKYARCKRQCADNT